MRSPVCERRGDVDVDVDVKPDNRSAHAKRCPCRLLGLDTWVKRRWSLTYGDVILDTPNPSSLVCPHGQHTLTRSALSTMKPPLRKLERLVWPERPVCPSPAGRHGSHTGELKGASTRPADRKCYACRKQFRVTVAQSS
jgi:hypothetical protein